MKKYKTPTAVRYLVNLALVVALFLIVNTMIENGAISRYYYRILYKALIFVIAAVSLNLTCGFLGQLPLGHAGFMAIGLSLIHISITTKTAMLSRAGR